jgi:superfamily I DNA/RNA helicase
MCVVEPQGVFDCTYQFDAELSPSQTESMSAWLSYHCEENFVFLRTTNQILAGGCTNSAAEWERRQQLSDIYDEHYQPYHSYQIRIMKEDQARFEMVWRDKIDKPNS